MTRKLLTIKDVTTKTNISLEGIYPVKPRPDGQLGETVRITMKADAAIAMAQQILMMQSRMTPDTDILQITAFRSGTHATVTVPNLKSANDAASIELLGDLT